MLTGLEALRLQCVHVNGTDAQQFSNQLLHDLAGNAFNAASAQCAVLCLMAVTGRIHQMVCQRHAKSSVGSGDVQVQAETGASGGHVLESESDSEESLILS